MHTHASKCGPSFSAHTFAAIVIRLFHVLILTFSFDPVVDSNIFI